MTMSDVANGFYRGDGNDDTLLEPDLDAIEKDHLARTKNIMKAMDPVLAERIMPAVASVSDEETAATTIQAHYRGYLARKQYVSRLYKQFEQDEQERLMKQLQQVEEGELLVEMHRLKVEVEEDQIKRHNRDLRLNTHVIRIQRTWREYKRRKTALNQSNEMIAEETTDKRISVRTSDRSVELGNKEHEQTERDSVIERHEQVAENHMEPSENSQEEMEHSMVNDGFPLVESSMLDSTTRQERSHSQDDSHGNDSPTMIFDVKVSNQDNLLYSENTSFAISSSNRSEDVLPSQRYPLKPPSFSELENDVDEELLAVQNEDEDEDGPDLDHASHRHSSLSPTEMLTLGWAATEMKLEALDATEALTDRHFMSVCDPNRVSTTSEDIAGGNGSPKPDSMLSKCHRQTGLQLVFVDDDMLESSGEETGRSPLQDDTRQQIELERRNVQGEMACSNRNVSEVRCDERREIETTIVEEKAELVQEETQNERLDRMEMRANPFHSDSASPVLSPLLSPLSSVAASALFSDEQEKGRETASQSIHSRILTSREQFEQRRSKPLKRQALKQLTLVQLICIVQNLQAQIEGASEALVEGLVERDEQKTKQDSLNAKSGELTRQARETHSNEQQAQQAANLSKKRWWKKQRQGAENTSK